MKKTKFLPLCGLVPVLAAGLFYAMLLKDIAMQTGDPLPLKLYALLLPAVLFGVAAAGLILAGALIIVYFLLNFWTVRLFATANSAYRCSKAEYILESSSLAMLEDLDADATKTGSSLGSTTPFTPENTLADSPALFPSFPFRTSATLTVSRIQSPSLENTLHSPHGLGLKTFTGTNVVGNPVFF